jgi:pimeloyl-ACP methyl ester carboxylesterase
VRIGLLTAGAGRALLLVHGGMSRLEAWEPVWKVMTQRWEVTAMDRRGRGASGDAEPYRISQEYDDIAAVAAVLAEEQGGPIDVFAHSYGATCALGAAARGAAFRRVVLYEPPGPQTTPRAWVERASAMVSDGRAGRAMFSFLTEIVGLSSGQVAELRDAPRAYDVLAIVSATLPREARAIMSVDLLKDARAVTCPVLLLLGENSPPWAGDITYKLAATIAKADVAVLPGQGHQAIDSAPDVVVGELQRFFAVS